MHLKIQKTTSSAPEIFEVFDEDGKNVGYLHTRWGQFTAQYYTQEDTSLDEGVVVYSASVYGFEHLHNAERDVFINRGLDAIERATCGRPLAPGLITLGTQQLKDLVAAARNLTELPEGFTGRQKAVVIDHLEQKIRLADRAEIDIEIGFAAEIMALNADSAQRPRTLPPETYVKASTPKTPTFDLGKLDLSMDQVKETIVKMNRSDLVNVASLAGENGVVAYFASDKGLRSYGQQFLISGNHGNYGIVIFMDGSIPRDREASAALKRANQASRSKIG